MFSLLDNCELSPISIISLVMMAKFSIFEHLSISAPMLQISTKMNLYYGKARHLEGIKRESKDAGCTKYCNFLCTIRGLKV